MTATPLNLTASASDVFEVSSDGEGDTIITMNGTTIEDEPTQNILALNISGGAATISVNFAGGDPLPVGGFYADVATVRLEGPHGSDPLVTTATAAMIDNDVIRYSPTTALTDNLTSDGGILAISGTTNLNDESGDSLIVAPGATVYVNGSQTFASLTIDAGATVRQISQNTTFGASVITVGSLNIENPDTNGNGGGVLDLGNGDLIVRDTDSSDIQSLLTAGYDGGFWDGQAASGANPASIISSAAANDPYQIESLGFAEIGTATDEGELNLTTFDGQTVSSGDAVVALTYYGDANLDREVNSTDYDMIGSVQSYTSDGDAGWTDGNFNYNGAVDSADTSLIDGASLILASLADGQNPETGRYTVVAHAPSAGVSSDGSGIVDLTVTDTKLNKTAEFKSVTYTVPANSSLYFLNAEGAKVKTITLHTSSVTVHSTGVVPNDGSATVTATVTWPDGTTSSDTAVITPAQ